jgi:NAD(P)-dependent dehydrogenase (short-subunit alcohol dehydrogenase family)
MQVWELGADLKPAAFEGKTCFVTGGASGIGRATALAFANSGAKVLTADIQEDGLPGVPFFQMDVRRP